MRVKRLKAPLQTVDAEQGLVRAVFSVFNEVDSDGDVVLPSFFTPNQAVPIAAWGHGWDNLPPGKGVIQVTPDHALLDGQFFMDTDSGVQHFRTVKNLGSLQEWSFGFRVLEAERGDMDGEVVNYLKRGEIFEASPVLIGANRNTYTEGIKGRRAIEVDEKAAIKPHKTATSDGTWDASAAWKNCGTSEADLRAACAWVDPEGDPAVKASYKFIHHEVADDGTVGAANETACSNGIGILNGGRSGTTIPDADRQGVYDHLAKHLKDAGKEPPELKSRRDLLRARKMWDDEDYVDWDEIAPAGSYEALAESLEDAFEDAQIPAGTYGYVESIATWPTHVILYLWRSGDDEGGYWDVPYTLNPDGSVTLGSPRAVTPQTVWIPAKARAMMEFGVQASRVATLLSATIDRAKSGADVRAKEGRAISTARRSQLSSLSGSLREHAQTIDDMLSETAPPEADAPKAVNETGRRLWLASLRASTEEYERSVPIAVTGGR